MDNIIMLMIYISIFCLCGSGLWVIFMLAGIAGENSAEDELNIYDEHEDLIR